MPGFPTAINAARATGYLVTAANWNEAMAAINAMPAYLLRSSSGTNADAGAANVDTFAMASGLTALDRLLILVALESVTQATANIEIYNATDSVRMQLITASLAGGSSLVGQVACQQYQSAATKIGMVGFINGVSPNLSNDATFSTAWTGPWTIALRHGGVTSGGTFKYSWGVWLLRGQ